MIKLWQAILGVFVGWVGGQVAGIVAVLFGCVAMVVAGAAFDPGGAMGALARLQADPLGSAWVFVPMLLATGVVQTLLACMVPALAGVPFRRALGLERAPRAALLLAPLGALALGPTSDFLASKFLELLPNFTIGNLEMIGNLAKAGPFPVMFVLMAVMPGVSEELLFRGVLQRSIRIAPLAIAASALVFACAHFDPPHVVGVLPMGAYLAWVAYRTDSTWPTIVAHVANNGVAIAATRISALDVGQGTDTPMPMWWVPVGLVVCVACVVGISLLTPKRAASAA